jgi:outer membrane receptor protein involved in Fe transport
LTNIEAGWKTSFWGGRAQFNGAIYQEKWENVQTGLFAPQLGFPNLQSFLNGPEYEVNGVEFNFVVAPMETAVTAGGSLTRAN